MAGISTAITVNVHTPRNFPVDLYYLTDVSRSIKKESIKSLGHLLGKQHSANVCLVRIVHSSLTLDNKADRQSFSELVAS